MAAILIIAPHADDETLGVGGTALAHIEAGDDVHWCLVTDAHTDLGFNAAQLATRDALIDEIAAAYPFHMVHRLGLPAAGLDDSHRAALIGHFGRLLNEHAIDTCYTPYHGDAHSDHRIIAECFSAAAKPFRSPQLRRQLAYEVLSETDHPAPGRSVFEANTWVDITAFLDRKIAIAERYETELAPHPFPRSTTSLRALAVVRGAQAHMAAAEAFQLISDRRFTP